MGDRLRTVRLVVGLILIIPSPVVGTAAGQTAAHETIVFVDAFDEMPSCCSLPPEGVARAALKELPGIIRISFDGARGQVAVTFDPGRVGRAEIIAALAPFGLQPLLERR